MNYQESFKKGSLEMLILQLLTEKDCYGYELSQLLFERTGGVFSVPEGSMYPALYKLSEKGYITFKKELVGKRRERVYYHIEENGRKYLTCLLEAYQVVTDSILKIIGTN
ncbi:MAG: PadR family transcriptional regulator [Lachnospiraceae bacterium]|nr:PadR family transcriptional regulator [Lachnospiraceae bacterium]